MSAEIFGVLISGSVALLVSLVTPLGQKYIARTNREAESEKVSARYREPLMQAAADLQSRLYNILARGFFEAFYVHGDERERAYAVNNTVYLFAQYFAWVEAVREEIQFIDLKDNVKTRDLSRKLGGIYSLMQTNDYGKTLRVFAGEQRAMGERMLLVADGRRCIGYGEFLNKSSLSDDPLFQHLIADVTSLAEGKAEARQRMLKLQSALIGLLNEMDPDCIRFPAAERSRLLAD